MIETARPAVKATLPLIVALTLVADAPSPPCVIALMGSGPFATLPVAMEGKKTRLTTDEVRHIALLARVGMTDEDLERMRDEMSHILENVDVLRQVDTEGVEPTGHSVDLETVMRDDVAGASWPAEEVLANAPSTEDDFIRVRAVLE